MSVYKYIHKKLISLAQPQLKQLIQNQVDVIIKTAKSLPKNDAIALLDKIIAASNKRMPQHPTTANDQKLHARLQSRHVALLEFQQQVQRNQIQLMGVDGRR